MTDLRLGDPVQETLLLTLYARALDAKAPAPILGDAASAELAGKIDYDYRRLKLSPSTICGTALRARRLDAAVRAFTAAHPDAVVVDLGCGLDTRARRCAPPPGVGWYDVDVPEVIELRSAYLPAEPGTYSVAADVTEPGWSAALPGGRPAMIVAEGLLPFLPPGAFPALMRELTARFPSGELAVNGYTRLAARLMKYHPSIRALGITAAEGFDGAREPEGWGAGLTLAEEQLLTRAPEVTLFPQPLRGFTRVMAYSTWMSRQGARVLRYRFGDSS